MTIKDIQKTHTLYTIELTVENMITILDYNKKNEPTLFETLDDIEGVKNTDYDEHLGPNIYLSVEYQDDNEKTWNLIEYTINQAIRPYKDIQCDGCQASIMKK